MSTFDATKRGRMAGESILAVWINGVKVGTLTEGQYAQMRQVARRDPGNAAAQARNLIDVLAGIAWQIALGVPLAMFWLIAAVLAFAPAEVAQAIQGFVGQGAAGSAMGGAPAVVCALQDLLAAACVVATLGWLAALAVDPRRLGLRNCYRAAVDRMLRMHCATPVEGRISVRRAIAVCGDAAVLVL